MLLAALVIRAGQSLSARTGLGLPFIEGWLEGRSEWQKLPRAASLSFIIAILLGSAAVGVLFLTWKLDPEVADMRARLDELALTYPAAWKWLLASLDAGISEEVFYRYVLVSLVVWLGLRLRGEQGGQASAALIWLAIVLPGLLFGWAHVDDRLGSASSGFAPLGVMVFTSVAGIVLGWLYWKYGLETAMLTHFLTDTVYLVVLVPSLLSGSLPLIAGVSIGTLLILALSCVAFARSGAAVTAGSP